MRKEDKERVLVEVTSRVLNAKVHEAMAGQTPLENLLNDALYHERKRLEREPQSITKRADHRFWREVSQSLGRASQEQLRQLLKRIIRRYVLEIMGNFSEPFYQLTTQVIPVGLMGLLNGLSPTRILGGGLTRVEDSIVVTGETEQLRRLTEQGTVLLAPTHSSHLDSVVMGWALYHMGLPPFLYGAGLNLFHNPVVGFFMDNLGAYRVDRKKRHLLYKDVLKEYTTYSVEIGYHNLFFPGGTRSRAGAVEQKLKLGLIGTGIDAYVNNLVHERSRPRIYVVPCTINFPLVLEAETLIDDYLKESGKARYIITDDEFSRVGRVWNFMREVVQLDSRITIRVGDALDVFGNSVDDDGRSIDSRGRAVDTSRYVLKDGAYARDDDRDRQYTRELGEAVARSYKKNLVLATTNAVAFAVFRILRMRNPELDLYRLLRVGGADDSLPLRDVHDIVRHLLVAVRAAAKEGELDLVPQLRTGSAEEVVADALRLFGTYHTQPALARKGDRIFSRDMNLLYYYHNRAVGYDFESVVDREVKREAA